MEWYVTRGKERVGPLSSRQLKELAGRGKVRPDDLLWTDGMSEGVPARTAGLFPAKGSTVTPPPIPCQSPSPPALPKPSLSENTPRRSRPRRRGFPALLLVGAGCLLLVLAVVAGLLFVPGKPKKPESGKTASLSEPTNEKFKGERPVPKGGADAADTDERRLQGNWTSTHEEFDGTVRSREEVAARNRLLLVSGDQMTIIRTEDGNRGMYRGTVKLDPSRSPKQFDYTVVGPAGNPVVLKGIYAFEGDSLKLCYRHMTGIQATLGRPDSFSAPAGSKAQLYHFRRATGEVKPGLTTADLAGVWRHSPPGGGQAEMTLLPDGKINDPEGNCTWTFDGVTLTMRWPNAQAPGGVWIDECKVSPDGKSYRGINQNKQPISGRKARDLPQ